MLDLVVLTRLMWEEFSLKTPVQLRLTLVNTRKKNQGIQRVGHKSGFGSTPFSVWYLGMSQG